MKFLTRTIIVLAVFNPVTGNLALGQNAPEEKLSTYTISGSVGLSDVEMQGLPGNPVTGKDGTYRATVPYGFSGRVRPVKEGYTFRSASKTYRKVVSDQANQNYLAERITLTISDKIILRGTPLQGVRVEANNGGGSDITDAQGRYSVKVPYGWSGELIISKEGFAFDPPSKSYTDVRSNVRRDDEFGQPEQPETAPPVPMPGEPIPPAPPSRMGNPTISGRTGLGGVRMYGLPGNVVTDPSGYYSVTVEHGWSGVVMPVKEGYIFVPPQRAYTNVIADQPNQNYAAKIITFIISGEVGVGGVVIKGLPGNPITRRDGTYQATVKYGWSGTVEPAKEGYAFEPPELIYSRVIHDQTNQNYSPKRVGPAPMLGRTGGRKVLVIPATDVKIEDLDAITQDLQVMSHIFDEKFKEPSTIKGVFTDFGDFFGRDNRATEAIYLQGYGALFLMEVNFVFTPPSKSQEQRDEETDKYVDPTWQRAKQKIFSPKGPTMGRQTRSEQEYGIEQIEELKSELIKTLKHASNIRNLKPDEWIILTVIGQGRQPGEFYEYFYRNTPPTPSSEAATFRRPRRPSSSAGGGFSGGMGGYSSMSSMAGGMASGGYGMGGMMGGYGGGMGGYGMGGYGVMGLTSPTILTIRAKKSDVDEFAKGEFDFEKFYQKVQIFTY